MEDFLQIFNLMRIYEMNLNILKFKISKIAKYIEIFK